LIEDFPLLTPCPRWQGPPRVDGMPPRNIVHVVLYRPLRSSFPSPVFRPRLLCRPLWRKALRDLLPTFPNPSPSTNPEFLPREGFPQPDWSSSSSFSVFHPPYGLLFFNLLLTCELKGRIFLKTLFRRVFFPGLCTTPASEP